MAAPMQKICAEQCRRLTKKFLGLLGSDRSQLSACRSYKREFQNTENKQSDIPDVDKDGFEVLKIPGVHTTFQSRTIKKKVFKERVWHMREKFIRVDQDWTDVWPTAATFNPYVVPLPIRQGYIDNTSENEGIVPHKYYNTELMKIPNFLHLTPRHIAKHCAAIKRYCSPWPRGLETDELCDKHFPVSITTHDYVLSGPTLRDPRARKVQFSVSIDSLGLTRNAKEKMIRLLGDRFDSKSRQITLITDVCPMKHQNTEYAFFLLTALYFESVKVEPWESEMTWADLFQYKWGRSYAKKKISEMMDEIGLTDEGKKKDLHVIGMAIADLHNYGETEKSIKNYKEAVLNLLDANRAQ